jgi:NADH-quinone oxidoreductase subunit N
MPINKLPLVYPQLVLTVGILTLLLMGLGKSGSVRKQRMLTVTGLLFFAAAAVVCLIAPRYGTLTDLLQFDAFAKFFLIIAVLAGALSLVSASQSSEISSRRFPEFAALLLTVCIGVSLLAAAQDLLFAYLAMEMVSLASYILTGFKRTDQPSHEAALKYVIFGGVASGVMVFGMSLLYGLTGTTSFSGIAEALAQSGIILGSGRIGLFAIIVTLMMILTGFCFKIAAVPFHQWSPDVYQGAPTPFTGFLSVAPKAAGFAVLLRFLAMLFPHAAGSLRVSIIAILGLVSAITMTLGNLSALHQKNVKRLLAYSSIAHAGYLLMGVAVLDAAGSSAVLIYLAIYLFMNLGAFTVVQTVADATGSEDLSAYRGLGYRSPFMAIALGVFLFSLAGIPPLAGFIGKFYLFAALIQNGGFWYVLLAVVGILNSVVALFYYALLLREMFFRPAEVAGKVEMSMVNAGLITVMLIPIVLMGVYWEPLSRAATAAVSALLL